ncbi:MAG: PilT/PilU family type 4a pilus ATPase [Planctomycetota bacterium]
MNLQQLLEAVIHHQASDLHLQSNAVPTVRIHGKLHPLNTPAMSPEDVDRLGAEMCNERQLAHLDEHRAVDFAITRPGLGRFRVAMFFERGHKAAALRAIPHDIPTIDGLNLPPVIRDIAEVPRGLVLVTGTTGSGKTSTLASMIRHQNQKYAYRIITIEDPIEFVHTNEQSLIAQREVGHDAETFLASLREAVRQDPDVVLVGELRDPETLATALQAADTGHLVFSTVHTTSASQTLQRLVALFPNDRKEMLLGQLANNLVAIISQRLARTADGKGRVPAVEILRQSPITRKLILENKPAGLNQLIANRENGMQLFDQHLADLMQQKRITLAEAQHLATSPEAVSMSSRGLRGGDLAGGLVS